MFELTKKASELNGVFFKKHIRNKISFSIQVKGLLFSFYNKLYSDLSYVYSINMYSILIKLRILTSLTFFYN